MLVSCRLPKIRHGGAGPDQRLSPLRAWPRPPCLALAFGSTRVRIASPSGPGNGETVSIKIELRTVDGEPAGTFATNLSDWVVGMEFRGGENELMRIVAIDERAMCGGSSLSRRDTSR